MQGYKRFDIVKKEIIPVAEKMRKNGIQLVMIHGFINNDNMPEISYEYAVYPNIESFHVVGETEFPSLGPVYDQAAEWPERELNELYGWTFEGLDISKRLFLPEDMLEDQGKGKIMVIPMEELKKMSDGEVEEVREQ